jgi:hydroxymethylglutaryl-CoA lyase
VARVEIVEVSPRDGLQNEARVLDTGTKLSLIDRAIRAGVRRMEVTSFAHPERVPQMADAEAVMAAVPRDLGVTYIGLVLNRRGGERAIAAAVDEVNVVVVATDTFSTRNQGMTTAEAIAVWADIAAQARSGGVRPTVTIAAAFGCPFEGEVDIDRVAEVAAGVAQHGPAEIALADTIGVGVPSQVTELTSRVADLAPGVPLRFHFHNTRNTGYANAVAAVGAGAAALDASIGGVGGCPFAPAATGNIATEDLVYLVERMGLDTGLSLGELSETAAWLGEQLGKQVPGLLGRAGPFPPS